MGLRLCWGAAAAGWICRGAERASESLQAELSEIARGRPRVPRLLVSPRITSAVALGLLRPTILLPAALAADGPRPTLRAVLAHEWAHVRNRDLWLLALGRCLLVVLYAHPLFWWLRRAVRNDQECLADAVAAGDDRPDYAQELLRWVRLGPAASPARAWAAVGIWENASQLSRRIAMLLDENLKIRPTGSRRWQCQAAGALVALGAALSLVTLQPGRSPAQQGAAAPAADQRSAAAGAVKKGIAFLEKGDLDSAAAAFTEAIRLDPKCARAYYCRALAYERQGKHDRALADCIQSVRIDPRSAAGFADNSIREKRSNVQGTIAACTEAIRQNPKSAEIYYSRALAYWQTDDFDKVVTDCTQAIELNSKMGVAYLLRAVAYGERGQFDRAIADYSEAIRIKPQDAIAYNNRSCAYSRKGQTAKALADAAEAIRFYPAWAEPYATRAFAYQTMGDAAKAIADYTTALRFDPNHKQAHWGRGVAYEQTGDRDKAVADYAEAIRPDVPARGSEIVRTLTVDGGSVVVEGSTLVVDYAAGGSTARTLDLVLPGYSRLGDPALRKELRLAPEQEEKLRAISAKYRAYAEKEGREMGEQLRDVPPSKQAKVSEDSREEERAEEDRTAKGRKQAD